MEFLQNHLEEEFLTKIIFVLKNTDLTEKDQYTIANIFKSKYTTELVDLTDSCLNLLKVLNEVDIFHYLNRTQNKNIILSQRFLDSFHREWTNLIEQQEERNRSTDYDYDFDMDLYHDQ